MTDETLYQPGAKVLILGHVGVRAPRHGEVLVIVTDAKASNYSLDLHADIVIPPERFDALEALEAWNNANHWDYFDWGDGSDDALKFRHCVVCRGTPPEDYDRMVAARPSFAVHSQRGCSADCFLSTSLATRPNP